VAEIRVLTVLPLPADRIRKYEEEFLSEGQGYLALNFRIELYFGDVFFHKQVSTLSRWYFSVSLAGTEDHEAIRRSADGPEEARAGAEEVLRERWAHEDSVPWERPKGMEVVVLRTGPTKTCLRVEVGPRPTLVRSIGV